MSVCVRVCAHKRKEFSNKMPGLINRHNNLNLPLCASEVTSCMIGYSLGMSASLTYTNMEDHPVEGLFIYPLDEFTTVVGFEAMISGRIITVQIKDKAKIDDCYFDCCNISSGTFQNGHGHFVMDEDLERMVFAVNFGIIPPLETVTVLISTSLELQTLPNGTVRLLLPSMYVPKLASSGSNEQSSLENQLKSKDRHRWDFSSQDQSGNQFCLAKLLDDEVTNPTTYEFSFQLEIRAPCLLAGVESPTHSIRADADPSAFCASSVMITLAEKHTFDRPVEIIIHPSEPHMPHILMESGDMTPDEYEQFLKGRNDFIKGTRKDPSSEKKTEIIRKRLNKDIGHNPVIMLNFCPDLKTAHPDLRMAQGEFLFLIDRSGSMSGVNINRVKDAMLVVLKSLMSSCLFNIIGFGSTFRTLFPASRSYNEETLAVACDYIRKIKADMGGTNLLLPLSWIFRQPIHRGHPRLLFVLTDGSVSNTGKVIELIRNHAHLSRCYSFGIGQNACRRLVLGLASASKGTAEFLAEGERLQPKMVNSLKKAMAPVLSDITIEWFFPATTEVLISPVGPGYLFPGDRLIGYCIVCDTSRYHPNLKSDKQSRCSTMWSQESNSSVFYHSQEEEAGWINSESLRSCRDSVVDSVKEQPQEVTSIKENHEKKGIESKTSPRRRAYSTNYIVGQHTKRALTPSDPASAFNKNPLRRARAQQLVGWNSPESVSPWQRQFQINVVGPRTNATRSRLTGKRRPSLLHQNCVSSSQDLDVQASLQQIATGQCMVHSDGNITSRSSTESASIGNDTEPGERHHQSSTLDVESAFEFQNLSLTDNPASKSDCRAVVSGLLCSEVIQWEVAFDLQSLLHHSTNCEAAQQDIWNETIHHLAAKSIIRDFEQMAEKECEIEPGSGRRYQLNAIYTSKACNIISKYTAFVPMYLDNNGYLPNIIAYSNTAGVGSKWNSQRSHSGSRKHRGYSVGLGRSQSEYGSDGADDGFSTLSMEDNNQSPCSTPSSSGWERCGFTEASLKSPSVSAQRSAESLFTARLSLGKTRMLTRAAKGFLCRSASKMSESVCEPETENNDYLPLVNLQLASGAFLLNLAFCEAINIPMEQLKWTSPFTCHRSNVSPTSHSHSSTFSDKKAVHHDDENGSMGPIHQKEVGKMGTLNYLGIDEVRGDLEQLRPRHFSSSLVEIQSRVTSGNSELLPPSVTVPQFSSPGNPEASSALQANSGRESETNSSDISFSTTSNEVQQFMDPEGTIWSTAVALAWLEHSSAAYFIEWELVAAKASMWLDSQHIPEGRELASVKASARQLFVLLRHWDENLQLNMLCYNPHNV
ncbi:von Willebrand factor A domain-containing protein 5B1 [Heterodontus francisci]|uniref:von Willebrand factor A domain-containing protein 5B1 n=1 Tax=Heterodontus francisci TaxID=7792 RepID=UPI00355C0662